MKPIILGINNQHSGDPAKALATDPHGASGYRLWQMLKEAGNRHSCDVTESHYMDGFDRRNLFQNVPEGITSFSRTRILSELAKRRVVMCGTKVPQMLGIRHTGFHITQQHVMNFVCWIIPHPSGLCREYNSQDMRARVGDLLWRLLDD